MKNSHLVKICLAFLVGLSIPTEFRHLPRIEASETNNWPENVPTSSTSTRAPVVKKRWAVMMIGGARTYAFAREPFLEDVLSTTDSEVDIFTYSFHFNRKSTCHVDDYSLNLLTMDSTVTHVDTTFVKRKAESRETSYDRFVRQQGEHLTMIDEYARQHNQTYDYILYTRPDLIFSIPLNLTQLEMELDKRTDNSLFSPACCKFGGLCDRLAAGSYKAVAHMIRISKEWYRQARNKVTEGAFGERIEYANLTTFDLPAQSFSFSTLRTQHVRKACHYDDNNVTVKESFPDLVCHKQRFVKKTTPELIRFEALLPGACSLLDHSSCPGDPKMK